jgi:hypothetical protein
MKLMKLAIILDLLESIKTYKDSTYAVMRTTQPPRASNWQTLR